MPAYMIVQLKVTDPDKFARYREAVPSVVEAFGGRYIVRGALSRCWKAATTAGASCSSSFHRLRRSRNSGTRRSMRR